MVDNNDGKIGMQQRQHRVLVEELRFPAFILFMGKRFIELIYKKKLNNVREN